MTESDQRPVALVTGGTAGLGAVIAETFLDHGYRVMIVGRDQQRLDDARERSAAREDLAIHRADVTKAEAVIELINDLRRHFGRLDVLVNCVGESDRGLIENLAAQRLETLFVQNVLSVLRCSQAAIPMLEQTGGVIVNIGSLASKVGARYLGGYPVAKHALAGLTQQMRLELAPRGIHVGLVSPGPIRRNDSGFRYQKPVNDALPDEALSPGGGTRIKGLEPQLVANAVVRCVKRRIPDQVLPRYLRVLIAIGHAFPRFGDWLLLRFSSSK